MTTDDMSSSIQVAGRDLQPAVARAVLDGAVVAETDTVSIDIRGPGAAQCLQGLLTNDVEGAGSQGFVYGAVLTPKGMIVSDLFVARYADAFTLFAPADGRDGLFGTLARSLPPRLAKATDATEMRTVLRMAGSESVRAATRAKLAVPDPGHAVTGTLDGIEYLAARPSLDRPYTLQINCARAHTDHLVTALERSGAVRGSEDALELRRVLDGWPRLGHEIGEKTLPQEVRFDEIEGVSYTKGCYTGQETVARVHFRGHANRWLGGLLWEDPPDTSIPHVLLDEKRVGRVSSIARLDEMDAWIGLAVLRRETTAGETVNASGAEASVVPLPFEFDEEDYQAE